jgi:Phasin protein
MAEKLSRAEGTAQPLPFSLMPAEFAEMGTKRIEDFAGAQEELFNRFQESNRQWFERMQTETTLASEFASKLTAARSIPDAMTVCQEWSGLRFEMMAEDGKHLLADAQKLMQTGARLLSNGWWSNGPAVANN